MKKLENALYHCCVYPVRNNTPLPCNMNYHLEQFRGDPNTPWEFLTGFTLHLFRPPLGQTRHLQEPDPLPMRLPVPTPLLLSKRVDLCALGEEE